GLERVDLTRSRGGAEEIAENSAGPERKTESAERHAGGFRERRRIANIQECGSGTLDAPAGSLLYSRVAFVALRPSVSCPFPAAARSIRTGRPTRRPRPRVSHRSLRSTGRCRHGSASPPDTVRGLKVTAGPISCQTRLIPTS